MFGDNSASLQVEVLNLDVGQIWRSQGTVTCGHKNGLQTCNSSYIKLPLLLFCILHSDHIQHSQQCPPKKHRIKLSCWSSFHPKPQQQTSQQKTTSNQRNDLPGNFHEASTVETPHCTLERAKWSAAFLPLVTWSTGTVPVVGVSRLGLEEFFNNQRFFSWKREGSKSDRKFPRLDTSIEIWYGWLVSGSECRCMIFVGKLVSSLHQALGWM